MRGLGALLAGQAVAPLEIEQMLSRRISPATRRAPLRGGIEAIERWLADELAGNGIAGAPELARQIVLLLEGCMVLILVHGDPTYADAGGTAAKLLRRGAMRQGTAAQTR